MSDVHGWIGFDGSWHCYGCGVTRHQSEAPAEDGCLPLVERIDRVLQHPEGRSRKTLVSLLAECRERLTPNAPVAEVSR